MIGRPPRSPLFPSTPLFRSLVVWDEAGPCFLADAVADPCAGMVAAAAVLGALAGGGRWLLDVSMRDVAAHLAGPRSGPGAAPRSEDTRLNSSHSQISYAVFC